MPTAPRSLKQLFLEALAIPPGERDAWLSRECADAAVRQQIELMLAAHDAPQSLLDRVAPPPVTATMGPATEHFPSDSTSTSTTIGPYKLLQQVGEGGMGVVYMAEQTVPVERRVALKIIKPGMDSRQVIARFEAERQALAMMDHPNIAKVFDAGTTGSGRPYFVMELVRGIPITKFCDEHQLTLNQRLELFLPVCHAVQHAHQKGIIHRDLKPSNVLVAQYDDSPVPKVIDFGIAKAAQKLTERTMFTEFGQVVGTLEYMSPEQARLNQLDIDTRSDIYSLGVLLYELLTGCTPFDGKRLRNAAFDEMLRIIREEEPPKPSTRLSTVNTLASIAASRNLEPARLGNVLRGELDWIVMKALEKDRNRRYETTNGLARDIERYLKDEPVQACPPSAAYRLRKFGRRNKAALVSSAVVLSALLIGIIVSTWQAIRATTAEGLAHSRLQAEERARRDAEIARDGEARQRKLAQDNATEAEGQRQRAEANFSKARQAVDEYLAQITENELLSVPGLQPLREDLLQAALKFYAEFTQERADDPTLQRELASAHYRLGTIQRELGNAEASQQANLEAIRLYEQLHDQGHEDVELQAALATAYFFGGRHNDTIKLCQEVMREKPEHGAVRSLLADTYNQLAVADSSQNKISTALKYHQQAFELREALVRDFPNDPRYHAQLGGTVNNLGTLLNSQGKREEGVAMFERAVEYSEFAYQRAPQSILWGRWLCTGLLNVANSQAALGRQEEALRSYERLVAVSRKRAFENPALGSLRADLYRAHLHLGRYHQQLGNAAEGTRCLRLAREVLEQTPRETPDQLFELAMLYAALAAPDAESLDPSADDLGERTRNADLAMDTLQRAVDAGYQNAAVLGTNQDLNPLRDREDFQTLLATVQKVAEADRLAKAEDKDAAKRLSNRQQAADLLRGLASAQPADIRHRATLASTLQSIGLIQTGLKQFDEAEKSLSEALKLREELLQEQNQKPQPRVDVLSVRAALGQLDWERDRTRDAHLLWQEILKECQKLAAEHQDDPKLQTGIVALERSINSQYGDAGLLGETLQSVDRGLKTGEIWDSVADFRGAHVLAALCRTEDHRRWCQMIVDKWHKTTPAQTVWATTMNPEPVVDDKRLLELAERVIKSNLDSLWKFKAATAWYRTGDYDRALELMLPARDRITTDGTAAALYWFALVYHKRGEQEDAKRYFEQAEAKYLKSADNCLKASPKSAVKDVHGGAWLTWAEDQAARRLAWKELRPDDAFQDPWPHLIQARGWQLLGEQEKSMAELAAADANTGDDLSNWRARLRLAARFEDAEPIWQHIVEMAAADPLTWIERGRWYAERGQHKKADADFSKAATLTPNELNKFLEAGWWAATTPEELSPLFPSQIADLPRDSDVTSSAKVVSVAPFVQRLEFRNLPELKDAQTAYAMTHVYSPETKAVTLLVGGNCAAELQVNGKPVRPWKANLSPYNAEQIPILLRQGRNTLVARVSNPGQPVSFILRIADNRLDRGLELAKLGFWDEAVALLRPELVKGQRLDPQVWYQYACALLASGEFAAHREFCDHILSWMGEIPIWATKLHVSSVCTLAPLPQIDVPRLVQLADEGVIGAKGATWAADIQSRAYFRAGRYQEVLDRTAAAKRPIALRALCWHHLGQADKAKAELARAEREFISLVSMGEDGPSSATISSAIHHALLNAVPDYLLLREAWTLISPGTSPNDKPLRALIAETRQQLEAADPRLLPFEKALIAGGKKPQAWLERGRARALLGQWELAQADLAKAVAIAPSDPEVLAARCLIYAELNHNREALADLDMVLDKDADDGTSPTLLTARQRLFDELGQWPELFEHVTRVRPEDPDPWIGRARYHASRLPWVNDVESGVEANKAMADLREAATRGFRDFDQSKTNAGWRMLETREDFKQLVRETADRNADGLILLSKLDAHVDVVRGVAFLPGGERVLSIARDKHVRLWNLATRSEISRFNVEGYLRDADLSADGRLAAVVSNAGEKKGVAHVWDLEQQQRLCELVQAFDWTNCIRISPDGTRVVTSGIPAYGVLWDVQNGKELRRLDLGRTSHTQSAAFSPDRQLLALGAVGRVWLFDAESGATRGDVRLPNDRSILDLAFDSSGKTLASGQMGGYVSLIDVAARRVTKVLPVSDSHVAKLRFINNDRYLLCSSDTKLQIWDVSRAKVVATVATAKGTSERMAVSRDGRYALTASGEQWDAATNKSLQNGDYAVRLWQLPSTVWREPEATVSEFAAEKPGD